MQRTAASVPDPSIGKAVRPAAERASDVRRPMATRRGPALGDYVNEGGPTGLPGLADGASEGRVDEEA